MSDDAIPAPANPGPGDKIADYRLEEQIGQGGMAVVYLARDERLNRQVALKLLMPSLTTDAAFRTRFVRETRVVAAVEHPNIVPVYDTGDFNGLMYIAMRYIRGGDVRALFGDGQVIDPARAADIVAQVAAALDTAHARGLVHRDVKPANMLLDASHRSDHVYLSDFGISRYLATTKLTATGQFVGTLDYVAPEQIEGRDLDGRADQYSLACTAYEMLTGVSPFRSDEIVAMISAHLMRPPPSAAARRPGLSEAVDQVLARAMAKSPADRYPTCTDFADQLSRALTALPGPSTVTAARPDPAPLPILSDAPPRRQKTPLAGRIVGWTLGTLAVAVVTGIVTVAVIGALKPPHPRHNPAEVTSPTSHFVTQPGTNPFAKLAGSYPSSVTAAVYDAATGRTYALHPGVLEDTAGIFGAEIMGTVLRQAQTAGAPPPGTELSLMTAMIEASDNNAATQLLAEAGGPSNVKQFDEMVGMTSTEPHATTPYIDDDPSLPAWGLTATTAADEVKLMRAFAYPNAVLDTTDRNYGIGLMEHVGADQDWGVTGGVAPGATVALKNGWLPLDVATNSNWQVDGIGWIKGSGRDYVLAVLTNGNASEQAGIDTISHISDVVYSALDH